MADDALATFGECLINQVRDSTIVDWDMIIYGRMKSPHAKRTYDQLSSFSLEQRAVLQQLIPQIVDTTLHHLLWMLEQEEAVDVAVREQDEVVPSLRDVSDGLTGELLDWIPRFSDQRYDPLDCYFFVESREVKRDT